MVFPKLMREVSEVEVVDLYLVDVSSNIGKLVSNVTL